ncbi:hypothetical protein ACIQMP_04210 [Streptomyces sp. NPDC091385]|uniref:hypothetical protein n=1 Tax=Streptomyces sp. NPDC091385 TaxID=3365997 RepID=UPI00381D1394
MSDRAHRMTVEQGGPSHDVLYTAIGLIPEIIEIQQRDDIAANLDHLYGLTRTAVALGALDHPVRLVVLPEGALQGFTDEIHDLPRPRGSTRPSLTGTSRSPS